MQKPNKKRRATTKTVFFTAVTLGAAVFAARAGRAQQPIVGPIPQAVVTPEYTYLPGQPQMLAPAQSRIVMHPQGRYVLVSCYEAALPPASLMKVDGRTEQNTALILYDAKLRRIRTLWEGRGPHRLHDAVIVGWLPQSDCALATVWDGNAIDDPTVSDSVMAAHPDKFTLLFFDFSRSLTGRAVAVSDSWGNMQISVSPTKPQFLVIEDDEKMRIGGSVRNGTLGPAIVRSASKFDFIFYDWNADGTAVFGYDPSPYPENFRWFMWDGKTPDITALRAAPNDTQIARKLPVPPAPVSPLSLRTGAAVTVPASLSVQTPSTVGARADGARDANPLFAAPPFVLHPLYLEAADAATAQTNPNRSTLIVPDADKSYLMPDQSAVLYQKSGATYVVPLTRIKNSAFVQLQKDVTMENARIIKYAIFSSAMGNGRGLFPTKAELTEALKKERSAFGDADRLLRGFVYTPPIIPKRDMDAPETVIIGYVVTPKGRAFIYANESVKWVDNP